MYIILNRCLQANAQVSLKLLQFSRAFCSFFEVMHLKAFEGNYFILQAFCRYFILQALAFICKHLQAHASLLKAFAVNLEVGLKVLKRWYIFADIHFSN